MSMAALAERPMAACVGPWEPLRVLGRGRRSIVRLARDPRSGVLAALKTRTLQGPDDIGFAPEHAALVANRHPRIVTALGHGLVDGTAWLALDHLPAGALPLEAPALDDAVVAARLHDVAEALAHLHAAGWVHRDLKPSNLLQRADGSLVLADFGSAVRIGTPRAAGDRRLVGSARYAAPEQVQGAPAAATADVYAAGVMLAQWLLGRVPFAGETLAEALAQHLAAPRPRLPAARARWQALLDALLAVDSRSRPTDGAALLEELRAFVPSRRACVTRTATPTST